MTVRARKAQFSDVKAILTLMASLAEFEGYADRFNVSPSDVEDIIRHSNEVYLFVADDDEQACIALAVLFKQPFTYDMDPWFILKEFIVDRRFRGRGVGRALFQRIVSFARNENASKIKWEVLAANQNAKRFYQKLGAEHQIAWQIFQLQLDE